MRQDFQQPPESRILYHILCLHLARLKIIKSIRIRPIVMVCIVKFSSYTVLTKDITVLLLGTLTAGLCPETRAGAVLT